MSEPTLSMTLANAGPHRISVKIDNLFTARGENMSFTVVVPYRQESIPELKVAALERAQDLLHQALQALDETRDSVVTA